MTWRKTNTCLHGSGRHRYTLLTDGERWQWQVTRHGSMVKAGYAASAKAGAEEARRWITAMEKE